MPDGVEAVDGVVCLREEEGDRGGAAQACRPSSMRLCKCACALLASPKFDIRLCKRACKVSLAAQAS